MRKAGYAVLLSAWYRSGGVCVQQVLGSGRWFAAAPVDSTPRHWRMTTGYSCRLASWEFGSRTRPPVGCAPDQVTSMSCRPRRFSVWLTVTVTVLVSTVDTEPSAPRCARVTTWVWLNAGAGGAAPASCPGPIGSSDTAATTSTAAPPATSRVMAGRVTVAPGAGRPAVG